MHRIHPLTDVHESELIKPMTLANEDPHLGLADFVSYGALGRCVQGLRLPCLSWQARACYC